MNRHFRLLLSLLLAVWMCVPGISSEGGEDATSTGIWILPGPCTLSSGSVTGPVSSAPRATRTYASLAADIDLKVSCEMGSASATVVDEVAGVPVALSVVGRRVRVPAELLQAMALQSGMPKAQILISDAAQQGYIIDVVVDAAAGSVTFSVR